MDAGDTLCDRMGDVLREPAPDNAVLTCFQRVMMLGFLGSYRSLSDPERQKLVSALNERVTPFSYPQTHPVLAESRTGRGTGGWLASWPARIGLSVIVLAALWWGLDQWLDQMLLTLVTGSHKMSPVQQRGLALWAALLSAVVCLGFFAVIPAGFSARSAGDDRGYRRVLVYRQTSCGA